MLIPLSIYFSDKPNQAKISKNGLNYSKFKDIYVIFPTV